MLQTNKKHRIKKLVLSLLVVSFGIIMFKTITVIYESNGIEHQIIRAIDNQCNEEGECYISLLEITDFEWDTVSVYITGGNWIEINNALGLTSDKTELQDGIVFSNNGKVVQVVTSIYDFTSNTHPKLSYWVERTKGEPYFRSYTRNSAILFAKKLKDGENYRYILIAE